MRADHSLLRTLIRTTGIGLVALAALVVSEHRAVAEEAAAIVAKSWTLFRQATSEQETITVDLRSSDGDRSRKALKRWTRYDAAGGEDRVMIKFFEPAVDLGLGLLIWRHRADNDDQWLNLPSLSRKRRIATADQEKYFAGTDLTFEDTRQLMGERTADFVYRFLSRTDAGAVIEAKPRPEVATGYGWRSITINPSYAITRIEYYGPNGALIKVQENQEIEQATNGRWRPLRITIDNRALKRITVLTTTERSFHDVVDDSVFSTSFLESRRF